MFFCKTHPTVIITLLLSISAFNGPNAGRHPGSVTSPSQISACKQSLTHSHIYTLYSMSSLETSLRFFVSLDCGRKTSQTCAAKTVIHCWTNRSRCCNMWVQSHCVLVEINTFRPGFYISLGILIIFNLN